MSQVLVLGNTSPFDQIRQWQDGREYWSARDLQELMGYQNWREFSGVIDRAMAACSNVGQNPESNFGKAPKVTSKGRYGSYTVDDYHLTRYACYLVAMNGDPRKSAVAKAQAYFAHRTREAALAQLESKQQPPVAVHTFSQALFERHLCELACPIPPGHFTIVSEVVTRQLPSLEIILNGSSLDFGAHLVQSIAQNFANYCENELKLPDGYRQPSKSPVKLADNRTVYPWLYDLRYQTMFIWWLWNIYIPKKFPEYQRRRAQYVAKQLGLPAPAIRKQIASASANTSGVQQMQMFS